MGLLTTVMNYLKELKNKMIGANTIENTFSITPLISSQMEQAIRKWTDLYEGKAEWLREPTWDDPTRVTSIGLPAFIASEKARTALIEFKSEITVGNEEVNRDKAYQNVEQMKTENALQIKPDGNSKRAEYLNNQYKKLKKQLRTQLEYAVAKGGLVIKPYVTKLDVPIDDYIYSIDFDFIQADCFYPLAFDGTGRITEAVFVDTEISGDIIYRRLEYHKWENGKDTIINRAFKIKANNSTQGNINQMDLGEEIPLTEVTSWKDIEPEITINEVNQPLFAYLKMPSPNTIDATSPLGVSCFNNAIELIKDADMQYSRYLWEYEGGQMAVDIDRDALLQERDSQGNYHSMMGQLQRRLYRTVDLGSAETYNVFAPALRDTSYLNGLNAILMRIEDVTGLSRGTLAEVSEEAKTATELKILKQRSYQSNADLQETIEDALKEVIYVMNYLCDFYSITPKGKYDVSFEWDDSIMTDIESEMAQRLLLQQNGVLGAVENRMWYMGETREQAIENLIRIANEKRTLEQISFGMTDESEESDETPVNDKNSASKAKESINTGDNAYNRIVKEEAVK